MRKLGADGIKEIEISFVRMIATCMIITCHICQVYNLQIMYWFNVGVQIFLFMSGWLYGKKELNDPIEFIIKNIIKILRDYWIYLFFIIPIYFIYARDLINIKIVAKALVASETITGLGHLWYIPYIICCYILTPLLYFSIKKVAKERSNRYFFYVFIICSIIFLYSYFYHWYFNSAWINCYILGFFMSKAKEIYSIQEKNYLLILTPICILSNSIKIYVEYINKSLKTLINNHIYIYDIFYKYCHVILGLFLFFLLFQFAKKMNIGKRKFCQKILILSDRYSYQIYITHGFFILSPFSIFIKSKLSFGNSLLLVLLITVVSAIFLKYCSNIVEDIIKE